MRSIIIILSFGALILANIVAVVWFYFERDFEPFITSLLIFAAITGFFVEKWISKKGKRKELLVALVHELYLNMNMLEDSVFSPSSENKSKFVVFPRLESSVVNAVIWSGSFSGIKDKNIFLLLHVWRENIQRFNQRLEITETACLLNSSPENLSLWRKKLSSGKVIAQVRSAYNEIANELLDKYSSESGINRNTELFK